MARMIAYRTPIKLKQSTIQNGINTITHGQWTTSSSFNAMNTNCRTLAENIISNAKLRPLLMHQTQMAIAKMLSDKSGTNVIAQESG
ncbi:hypothetical protein TTRE_0000207101 [Trichuris trichiura]|uniref:Uncharacterized protein n=1 Tax=Trichuris trichiura TaxID=36087 RepID=A0A077Z1L5_TRITR|nr:hypothetical protein TTRE_0000207101 [Trichuris trichiura]